MENNKSERLFLVNKSKDLTEEIRKKIIIHEYQKELLKKDTDKNIREILIGDERESSIRIEQLIKELEGTLEEAEIAE
jgi:hypothetical protein